MGLNFTLPTEKVDLPGGGDITVRGLGLEDVTVLLQKHGVALAGLFTAITAAKATGGEVDINNMASMAGALAQAAPKAAAEAIALAADAADQVDNISKLNLTVQIQVLEKIGKMTFTSERGLGELLEIVINVAKGTTGLVKSLREP